MPDDYTTSDFDSIFEDSGYVSRSEAKKLARDEVQKTLSDINTFGAQAQAGVQNAIREITARHPDFEQQRSRMLATLDEVPLLKDAIGAAEANPQLAPTLPAMYEILWRASQAPAGSNTTAISATSEPSKLESQDLSDESTQYRAALASQRVDLSPENRKVLIAELEKRGVGDIEF
jgi:hypothetical protein